ncbi:TPA: hypothetical protein DDW35_09885, partial [Candidatus Sumerlaeota bacterium]|nr:hypothetical protein [Candidatus Sumerlaeota bacterium]
EFPQLPNGYYEISCEHPTERSGEKCVATAKTRIEIRDYNPHAWLNLRSDRVVIKGRITGNQGNPVAGAKVIGKLANLPYNPQIGNPPEEYVPPTFTTLSSADGSYVLEGFDPTEILAVAKYLAHAHPEYLRYAEMRVEHPGLTQDATRITKATLLTEDAIAQARRLMAALNKTAYQKSEGRKLLEEKKGLAFPAMQGGTVTGVDIALDPAK